MYPVGPKVLQKDPLTHPGWPGDPREAAGIFSHENGPIPIGTAAGTLAQSPEGQCWHRTVFLAAYL